MSKRLVITGGGTGGHLFPGIAVADEVLSRFPGSEVLFIGTGREIDQRALAAKPYRRATLTGSGLKGISWAGRLLALLRLPVGFCQAWRLLRRFKPQLVLGVGGYVTGPVLLAARLQGITTAIHEQNSVPGLANRWLGKVVHLVFLTLPGSEKYFPVAKTRLVGNPLRAELVAAATEPVAASRELCLLVLGGSQGAHRLNQLLPRALARLAAEGIRLRVIHQSGSRDVAAVAAEYRQAGIEARVEAFISDMAAVYQQAGLVVSRAGATTLAELTLFGKPALLVPYPYAADDHQRLNAEIMVEHGAAVMKLEAELDEPTLAAELKGLLTDEPRRQRLAARSRELARPAAAAEIIANVV